MKSLTFPTSFSVFHCLPALSISRAGEAITKTIRDRQKLIKLMLRKCTFLPPRLHLIGQFCKATPSDNTERTACSGAVVETIFCQDHGIRSVVGIQCSDCYRTQGAVWILKGLCHLLIHLIIQWSVCFLLTTGHLSCSLFEYLHHGISWDCCMHDMWWPVNCCISLSSKSVSTGCLGDCATWFFKNFLIQTSRVEMQIIYSVWEGTCWLHFPNSMVKLGLVLELVQTWQRMKAWNSEDMCRTEACNRSQSENKHPHPELYTTLTWSLQL